MQTQVKKWGNSLALRIPKAYVEQMEIELDSSVEISIVDGTLVVVPIVEEDFTLDDLLAGITEENIHAEISTGPSIGREAW